MVHRSTLKTARTLLDRFFRDAEGHTNHKIDVGFLLAELGLTREKADPAIDFLVSRGLLNAFGPEVAFLTDEGVQISIDEIDIGTLGPARAFGESGEEDNAPPPMVEPTVPPHPQLVYVALDGATFTVPLGSRCMIGRSPDNDIPIEDQRASKRHAVVRYERGAYVLEDLESANGTLLNGVYCVEPTRLKNDDEVVIGRTMLVYQAPETFAAPSVDEVPSPEPRLEPSGSPTARPSPVAPELATPGLKVVRGRPEASGPTTSSRFLFEGAEFEQKDRATIGQEPIAESDGLTRALLADEPQNLDELAVRVNRKSEPPLREPLEDDSELDTLEAPDLRDLDDMDPPTVDAPSPLDMDPDAATPLIVPVEGSDLRSRREGVEGRAPVPRLSEDLEDLRQTVLPNDPPVELSEVVVGPNLGDDLADFGTLSPEDNLQPPEASAEEPTQDAFPDGAPPTADFLDQSDSTGPKRSVSVGYPAEELPVATASYVDLRAPDIPSAERSPRFLADLTRLRARVVEVAGSEVSPLLDSIDRLLEHPLVRAFAEDEDRDES